MQGAREGKGSITDTKYSRVLNELLTSDTILCLQEAGLGPLWKTETLPTQRFRVFHNLEGADLSEYASGSSSRRSGKYLIVLHQWDIKTDVQKGASRVNTGIIADNSLVKCVGPSPTVAFVGAEPKTDERGGKKDGRAAVGVCLLDGSWVFSFHAWARSWNNNGRSTIEAIDAFVTNNGGGRWFIGADWNQDPADLKREIGKKFSVCATDKPTHFSTETGELTTKDYVVTNQPEKIGVVSDRGASDHCPVTYSF
jgi:hypothetical protein